MNYYEMVSKVRQFSVDSGIAPWELQRIAKQMCCCGTCKYFVQHSKKQSTQSCSSWEECI